MNQYQATLAYLESLTMRGLVMAIKRLPSVVRVDRSDENTLIAVAQINPTSYKTSIIVGQKDLIKYIANKAKHLTQGDFLPIAWEKKVAFVPYSPVAMGQ